MRKFCFSRSHILRPNNKKNACEEFVWELRIPLFILVHDLCGIEVCIVIFKTRILISINSKLSDKI